MCLCKSHQVDAKSAKRVMEWGKECARKVVGVQKKVKGCRGLQQKHWAVTPKEQDHILFSYWKRRQGTQVQGKAKIKERNQSQDSIYAYVIMWLGLHLSHI